ncbi:MAG: D-alanyl-D-alanine carboxypeptidase, partial [Firmicutes bacterium]|nr:D-alanyl-D-alanine carboxypeptidase [Bacillota bacterium]
MLMDMKTGQVITEQNADEIKYPASITKVMTAYLVLTHVDDLSKEVTSPKNFKNVGESSAGILPNET